MASLVSGFLGTFGNLSSFPFFWRLPQCHSHPRSLDLYRQIILWYLSCLPCLDFIQAQHSDCMPDTWPVMPLYFFRSLMSGSLNDFLVSGSTQLSFTPESLWKAALFCLNRKLTISGSIRILLLRGLGVSYSLHFSCIEEKPGKHPVHLKTTFHDFRSFISTLYPPLYPLAAGEFASTRLQCFISRKTVTVILNSLLMKSIFEGRNTM